MASSPLAPIVSLAVSAVMPYLLERLKRVRWAVFIDVHAPRLNRVTGLATAILTALGVTVTVGDPDPEAISALATVALQAAANWLLQELVYRRQVREPGR